MSIPKISIIVPIYNTENKLHRCIDSILAQTFTDFELILINDGSKDNSGTICDEYAFKDSRVRVFHKENGGVSSARNMGLDNAKGEWVTFCDSDDYVYTSWLENYNILGYGDKYDLICQGISSDRPIYPDTEKTLLAIDYQGTPIETIDELHKNLILGYTPIKAFRLNVINKQKLRFDVRLKFKEDEMFVIKYMQLCKKCICLSKKGYFYNPPIDWNKYKQDFENEKILYENLFAEVVKLGINKKSKYFISIREQLTNIFMQEFYRNQSNRKECLKGLRKILKIDYRGSQLFMITKFFIYLDPTMFISKYILLTHLRIKYGKL